ncbi:protein of unknown function [Methylotuvimicrobium alcaliphilum 20Z]|uniref:Uncharacterized protein n=1 Tax=Methylotuvimicrobium alcaliphilum (strain DSM 19304 / NCIMB 14124 / VKM B-2133 / 20Z) TaxID=1091494 RepID=G4T269_META2|nr:protein of unknown function [Methylotuvimicrobium alcaliphilum 20Z]
MPSFLCRADISTEAILDNLRLNKKRALDRFDLSSFFGQPKTIVIYLSRFKL